MSIAPPWPDLLPDAARAGLYQTPDDRGGALPQAAQALRYAFRRIDLSGCRDKGCVLDRIAGALAFPDWFGRNWDALADCLTDLTWLPAPGYVLVVEHGEDAIGAAQDEFLTALDVLGDAAAYWREQGIPFWIFVDPAIAPPSLPRLR